MTPNKFKSLFSCITFLLAFNAIGQTTISGGNVSGTWTKSGSPYKVNGNITIPNGSTLTIEPGVIVQFAQRKSLVVDGRIIAKGGAKSTDSIWFTRQLSLDTSSWKGIKFFKTATTNDTSVFKYCVFRNCRNTNDSALAYLSGGVTVLGYGKVKIANSTFYNNESCFGSCIYILLSGYVKVQSCTFKNNAVSEFYYWDGTFYQPIGPTKGSTICVYRNSNCIIDSCSFKNNTRGKQYKPNPSINYDAATVFVSGSTYYKQNCYANITNSVFDGNEGVTLHSSDKSFVNVNNCNFINAPKSKSTYLVYSEYLSDLKILNSTFSSNKGYALFNAEGSKLSVRNSEIKNNENWISIIQNDPSYKTPTLLFQNCKITNNNKVLYESTHSSGLTASTINNCLIANNKLDVLNSSYLINNTIVNNSFGVDGIGGNPYFYPSSNANNINVFNTIIWGNKLDTFPNKQILIYPNTAATFKNCIIENDTASFGWYSYGNKLLKPSVYSNNLSSNPQFVSSTAGVGIGYNASVADFSIKSNCNAFSSAINAGGIDTNFLGLPKLDLAGNVRFYENRVDIGAYEDNSGTPFISITKQAKNDSLCEKSRSAELSLTAIGKGLAYQWQRSIDGGANWSNIVGQVNAKLSIANTTSTQNTILYRSVLTGTCDKDTSIPKQIITFALPIVNLGADTAICKNNSIQKTISTGGTYLWQTGNTSNTLSQFINKDSIWWVQITSVQGCKNRDTLRIQKKDLPVVNLGSNRNLNKNAQLILDAGAGASSYLWNNGIKTQTYTFLGQDLGPAGAYTLWAQATGSNGCSARDSIVITVIDNSSIHSVNNSNILVYPQPAYDFLNITMPEGIIKNNTLSNFNKEQNENNSSSLTIYSLDGKIILKQVINESQLQVSVQNFESGVYLISIVNQKEIYQFKWIKA